MLDLNNIQSSYLIISSDKLNDIISILYAKEYRIVYIKNFYQGHFNNSIIAYINIDNNELRKDALFLLNHFKESNLIIKYNGEDSPKKIFFDGSEKVLSINLFNTNSDIKSYIHDGFSFSFNEEIRYWIPKDRKDFKDGMIVEYFNNNKWCQKKINNISEEYDKFFKLLLKYNKIRIPSILQ